ncbi:hypothetical protein BH09BAC5_BH09BAC5_11160 [soil metagenome]
MNKLVRISTSLLLSLLILVSGSGLIIGKMVCLKSGMVIISANEAKDCCEKEDGKSAIKDNCCAINNITFQQQHFVGQNQLVVNSSAFSIPVSVPEYISPILQNNYFSSHLLFTSDPPELISGSSALPLLCVFRV